MPTNANSFNSRVTSEALEKKFRDTFPSQGGAELVQDLFAQGVIVPTVDFTAAAEGSELPTFLQTAWDFATQAASVSGANVSLTSTPGFWKVDLNVVSASNNDTANIFITDGLASKVIWDLDNSNASSDNQLLGSNEFYVFLRAGDDLRANVQNVGVKLSVSYRQVADVNGNLVNPLGFVFQ